ncbi:S-ribosylhomocysteine lyase [Candidatus Pantoea edessiphila]|uniref:S-ribosylhomocysteine lyase n=1 Tax=Candidatus Pantoea edessiphila TaxID=2044610 RepID=UPI003BAEB7AD
MYLYKYYQLVYLKIIQTLNKDCIAIFDLRFCRPNIDALTDCTIHTIEYLLSKIYATLY